MGRHHIYGMAELRRTALERVELVAVADRDRARADSLADEAHDVLGRRPRVFPDLSSLAASGLVDAVSITAQTDIHADLCCGALEAGLHVLVEKPLAVTIEECLRVQRTLRRSGCCLAVAENIRREAGNRLARAVISAGMLGEIRLVIDQTCSGSDAILLTPWCHTRAAGGVLLDVIVHHADLIEYLAGPVERVAGRIRLAESRRYARDSPGPVPSAEYYRKWQADLPAAIDADAEDEAVAVLQFRSGALGSLMMSQAAHGRASRARWLYGSKGSMYMPPDRSGRSPVVTLSAGSSLEGATLVDTVPAYRLDDISASVYGEPRPVPRGMPFTAVDRKLVAIELGDFIEAVRSGRAPEMGAEQGTRNVALVWAVCEASVAGEWVDVAQVERGDRTAYQATLHRR